MRSFILRRIIISVVVLFLISMLIYALMRSLPSSYIEQTALERSAQPGALSYTECLRRLEVLYGLDKNPVEGYIGWLGSALTGDFGDSWVYNVPVVEKVFEVIPDSLALALLALFFEVLIAVPLGILAAKKRGRGADLTVSSLALVSISLPSFFFAALLKYIFSVKLGLLESVGKYSRYFSQLTPTEQFFDIAAHYLLPVVTLTIAGAGFLTRYTRTNMLDSLGSDYIRTARANGLPEKRVVAHAFRNTLVPLISMIGTTLPSLFSGAMIVEQMFSIPGIGYTSYTAIVRGDIPFSMFYLLFLSFLTVFGTLLSDILYAAADPRVRRQV